MINWKNFNQHVSGFLDGVLMILLFGYGSYNLINHNYLVAVGLLLTMGVWSISSVLHDLLKEIKKNDR